MIYQIIVYILVLLMGLYIGTQVRNYRESLDNLRQEIRLLRKQQGKILQGTMLERLELNDKMKELKEKANLLEIDSSKTTYIDAD